MLRSLYSFASYSLFLGSPFFGLLALDSPAFSNTRPTVSLAGDWYISIDEGQTWKPVTVPATFEQQIDRDFDGVAWLRRSMEPPTLKAGQRWILHFDAIATEAEILVNGQTVGRHLGGWTPIRCDATEAIAQCKDAVCELLVKVDEKVGHNTQGFLPVIAPHFGGIWQEVRYILMPEGAIDDLQSLVWGDLDDARFQLDIRFAWGVPRDGDRLCFAFRRDDESEWSQELSWQLSVPATTAASPNILPIEDGRVSLRVPISAFPDRAHSTPRVWSPAAPCRYEIRVRLLRDGAEYDVWNRWTAFRKIATRGRQLFLNDQPLIVRGLLNWGYQQDGNAPTVDPAKMRQEIEFARSRGFNLMKFCLWVPPKAYLDLLDEHGMLGWIEYPAWHPQFTPEHLEPLRQEYTEFFHYDRCHPSVILRSLTCETGPSADLQVIQSLYDRCHALVPNALVEDDSSWIQWNRVHDFYDDHPYGNNHTWVETLDRLNRFIDEREAKPLLLGEAIAADTWYDPDSEHLTARSPASLPIFAAGNREWRDRMQPRLAPGSLDFLEADSHHYAHLMRKYQLETFRREVPDGGYVVSVIRDFSLAAMGLIDYFDEAKSTPADWHWHGDRMLLLRTEHDRRSFAAHEPIEGSIYCANGGMVASGPSTLEFRIVDEQGQVLFEQSVDVPERRGNALDLLYHFSWQAPEIARPTRVYVHTELRMARRDDGIANRWPIWLVPDPKLDVPVVKFHPSWDLDRWNSVAWDSIPSTREILATRQLDNSLLDALDQGARVLLVPNREPGSPIVQSHWFLRGGPIVSQDIVNEALPRAMLVELQHFDLASDVIPNVQEKERFHPLVMLWDNHDIPQVKTHGLVLEMPVGNGSLLISALRHDGGTNAAGRWLLGKWLKRLANDEPHGSEQGVSNLAWLREQLSQREFPLTDLPWKFQPDAEHHGDGAGWHASAFDDREWPVIRIDRHWESQGHEALDGWAWYRTSWTLPDDWPKDACYLSFTGVDDYYRCYVNGELVGTGGDLEKRQTAFDERKSHDISRLVKPGKPISVVVEVYDWYGAGGIFRPVVLTTTPIRDYPALLRPKSHSH